MATNQIVTACPAGNGSPKHKTPRDFWPGTLPRKVKNPTGTRSVQPGRTRTAKATRSSLRLVRSMGASSCGCRWKMPLKQKVRRAHKRPFILRPSLRPRWAARSLTRATPLFFAIPLRIGALDIAIICDILAQFHQRLAGDRTLTLDIALQNFAFFDLLEDDGIFFRAIALPGDQCLSLVLRFDFSILTCKAVPYPRNAARKTCSPFFCFLLPSFWCCAVILSRSS